MRGTNSVSEGPFAFQAIRLTRDEKRDASFGSKGASDLLHAGGTRDTTYFGAVRLADGSVLAAEAGEPDGSVETSINLARIDRFGHAQSGFGSGEPTAPMRTTKTAPRYGPATEPSAGRRPCTPSTSK